MSPFPGTSFSVKRWIQIAPSLASIIPRRKQSPKSIPKFQAENSGQSTSRSRLEPPQKNRDFCRFALSSGFGGRNHWWIFGSLAVCFLMVCAKKMPRSDYCRFSTKKHEIFCFGFNFEIEDRDSFVILNHCSLSFWELVLLVKGINAIT